MHLHPSQFIPANYLLKTEISVIELHRNLGGPVAKDLYSYHSMILEKKLLIIWGDLTDEDLDYIHSKLSPKGLLVIPVVKNKQQAREIWGKFNK